MSGTLINLKKPLSNLIRASYDIAEGFPGALVIMDCLCGKTVTNDVDGVLRDLEALYGSLAGYKIMYRDSDGIYDGIQHDNGRFITFFSINERDAHKAYQKLMQKQIR